MSSATSKSTLSESVSLELAELDKSAWIAVVRYLIALNTCGSNAFLLYLFARYRNIRVLQCNRLIALNAFTDFMIATPFTGFMAANQITILGLAADRLWAVYRPLEYSRSSNNNTFVWIVVTLSLFVAFALIFISIYPVDNVTLIRQCSLGVATSSNFLNIWTVYAEVTALLVFAIYTGILVLFFRYSSSLTPQVFASNPPTGVAYVQAKRQQKIQKRITVSVFTLLSMYGICWALPTLLLFIFNTIGSVDLAQTSYITYVQAFLGAWNAGLYLYIYLFRHDEIRSCAKRCILDLFCNKINLSGTINRVGIKPSSAQTVTPAGCTQ
ncbi:serpentine type 7TM GPCR chemoreceptor srsx domain-containing protein [Ditylenchus destructor]|uniref:Serpentine type 7TM GPCR chemoreceptor srsx domain-containing protein n=1 Tax=Ditylenchus destructor TaxID=166010 RepID=A0AAD4MNP1_9BILA|nr:serpentine type 7TM GPCR chemoreceptor srsx domain-containing protein [Ditylenchus destructor]